MLRKFWNVLTLILSLYLGCLSTLAIGRTAPDEVRFAYAGGPRVWILGKIDGSFDKALGTKVKWIPFASGADVLTLFAAKEIDIARFGASPAAVGIARKLPIEIIGVPEVIATSERLIARNGINSLKDLEGKTVAFPANSTAQYAFEVAIKLAKIDRSKIKTLTLKPADIISTWSRGDIDAAYVWGPFTQQLEQAGGKEIYVTKNLQKDGVLIFNNYVVRKEFAEKYPQLVIQFLKVAADKAVEYKKDPEGSAQLIAKHLDIPLDTVRSTLAGLEYPTIKEQLSPSFLGAGKTQENARITKQYKDIALFLASIGELKAADVPSSYVPFINTEYLQRAAQLK